MFCWRSSKLSIVTTGDTVAKWLTLKPNEYHDVSLCGRVFGGRYGESLQIPRRYEYDKDVLRIYFGTTEVLTVVGLSPALILGNDSLVIPGRRASDIRLALLIAARRHRRIGASKHTLDALAVCMHDADRPGVAPKGSITWPPELPILRIAPLYYLG